MPLSDEMIEWLEVYGTSAEVSIAAEYTQNWTQSEDGAASTDPLRVRILRAWSERVQANRCKV